MNFIVFFKYNMLPINKIVQLLKWPKFLCEITITNHQTWKNNDVTLHRCNCTSNNSNDNSIIYNNNNSKNNIWWAQSKIENNYQSSCSCCYCCCSWFGQILLEERTSQLVRKTDFWYFESNRIRCFPFILWYCEEKK